MDYWTFREQYGAVRARIDFGTYFLLFKLYGLEHNYYANYFWEGSNWCGVG
jgi:hypothetical protein